MSHAQIAVLALAAVLVFWMVGAYNRLVALRNAIAKAWSLVDEVLARRGEAVTALVQALREPLAGEHNALDALQAAAAQVRTAAAALSVRPVDPALAAAVVAAESAMSASASRVLALLELHEALRHDAVVAPQAQALRDSASKLGFARQLFNEAAAGYDEAVRLFPTRLLADLYRFRPAGRL